jgi:hypothetical protein
MIVESYFHAIITNFGDNDGITGTITEVGGRDFYAVVNWGDGPRRVTVILRWILMPSLARAPVL